jgi:hypothetical protein
MEIPTQVGVFSFVPFYSLNFQFIASLNHAIWALSFVKDAWSIVVFPD